MIEQISINFQGIHKQYGKKEVVKDLNLTVTSKEIFGLIGPNGSGKSTVIKLVAGLETPSKGSIEVLGSRNKKIQKNRLGYMSQGESLYLDLTVLENLYFYAHLYGLIGKKFTKRIWGIIELLNLGRYADFKLKQLSQGWRQKVSLGCTILHSPPVLLLDEPTAGVDPIAREEFWQLVYNLRGEGLTVMVTTHYVEDIKHCDRIGFMVDGRLVKLLSINKIDVSFQKLQQLYNEWTEIGNSQGISG